MEVFFNKVTNFCSLEGLLELEIYRNKVGKLFPDSLVLMFGCVYVGGGDTCL